MLQITACRSLIEFFQLFQSPPIRPSIAMSDPVLPSDPTKKTPAPPDDSPKETNGKEGVSASGASGSTFNFRTRPSEHVLALAQQPVQVIQTQTSGDAEYLLHPHGCDKKGVVRQL